MATINLAPVAAGLAVARCLQHPRPAQVGQLVAHLSRIPGWEGVPTVGRRPGGEQLGDRAAGLGGKAGAILFDQWGDGSVGVAGKVSPSP